MSDSQSARVSISGQGAQMEPPMGDALSRPDGVRSHPLITFLFQELPRPGDFWASEKQKKWLDCAAAIFKVIYQEPKP